MAEPPAESPSTRKISVSAAFSRVQSVSLPGQAQPPRGGLAGGVLALAPAQPFLRALDDEGQQVVGLGRVAGQPVVEAVAQRGLHQPCGLGAGELLLGLALELRVAQEHRQLRRDRAQQVLGHDLRCAPVAALLAPGAQALQQRGAEPRLVRAALRGGDGVAVGVDEALALLQPGRPPIPPGRRRPGRSASPAQGCGSTHGLLADIGRQAVAQAAREVQHRLGRRVVLGAAQQRRVARPADLHAAEQVGLGAAQPVQPRRAETERCRTPSGRA